MAIYHMSVKVVQRSKGRSSVACAAYRAADKLLDKRTGAEHDFSRKTGLIHAEIITPDGSQIERSALWNMAEQAEKRKDATTAREYEIALPAELSPEERKNLAQEFCQYLIKEHGCAVDLAIHAPAGDERNFHAHILTTTRIFEKNSLGAKCDVELSDRDRKKKNLPGRKEELLKTREAWEKIANRALEKNGHEARIDHRTLEAQGIVDRLPTKHLGHTANAILKKGRNADRAADQREALTAMENLKEITADIEAIKFEIAQELALDKKIDEKELKAELVETLDSNSKKITQNPHLQEKWKKPYLDYIEKNGLSEENCKFVLERAEFDTSEKGKNEIKNFENILNKKLSQYCLMNTIKEKMFDYAMCFYKLSEDRHTNNEGLQIEILDGIDISVERLREKERELGLSR